MRGCQAGTQSVSCRSRPGRSYDSVTCCLRQVRIKHYPPPYEAVSYVWGDKAAREDIVCDGRVMKVTPSVHEALKRIRQDKHPRLIWVDAICIYSDRSGTERDGMGYPGPGGQSNTMSKLARVKQS